jgi:hypothetical protein
MILRAGTRVASRRSGASPTTRQPGGSPPYNRCVRRLALPPGCRVVAHREVDGMPHPLPNPAWPQQCSWPAISEICPPGEGMILRLTRSSGRPSKPPDHGPQSSADQRTSFVVSQRCISLLSVVSSAETAHRRPRSGILNAESVHAPKWRWPLTVVAWRTRCVREIPSVNVV